MSDDNLAGYEESISAIRFIARINGLWPFDKGARQYQCAVPACLIIFFIIIPQTTKAIYSRNDLDTVVEVLSTCELIEIVVLLKLFGLLYNKRDFQKLLTQVEDDWKISFEYEQKIMWSNARFSKLAAIFCVIATAGSVILHSFLFLLSVNSINKSEYNNSTPVIYQLFIKSHFPFETQNSPIYEIICFSQFSAAFLSTFVFSTFDGYFFLSILHFSGQLYNLKYNVYNLITQDSIQNKSFTRKLAVVVCRHRHIMSYIDLIENNFNLIFLLQIFSSTVVLCMQGYQFVLIISQGTRLFTSIVFIIFFMCSSIISIFVYCYIAEIIRTESDNLLYAVYEIDWINLKSRDANLLLIFMSRLILPVKITVGKLVPFSLEYFTTVMKTSAGYLSVLLAVAKD
ncbi:odorant receptor 22c-like [Trichogramma pretiosum]|uniref:odorant receptor 22c-like n=1 Tax=Trichogramma pretiosum TaxID=7493 RepID=UPI0006C97BDB|nr:odorant receptor 22c-like [Trichogramma pretiosum]